MAHFSNLMLTAKGVRALLEAQMGKTLNLSKIGLGSGTSNSIVNLTNLVKPEILLPISEKKVDETSGHISLISKMTNESVQTGFFWKETGLFFEDSEGKDVLFAYSCTEDKYDYVPAYSDNRYVKHIRIADIITDSYNINITESEGLTYVDTITFEKFAESHGRVLIGSSGTPLEKNDTLFVIEDEDDNQEFKGASFTNVVHEDGKVFVYEGGKTFVQSTEGIISGDLTVSDQYQDAVFLAKI